MSDAPVYASDEHPEPDSAFAPGELRHLVVGNCGRLLDARCTPITVVDVAPERGSFVVRVEAFEDTGVRWELGLEEIELSGREGHPVVYALVDKFLSEHDLHELEHGFTESFVTNPRAGEIVKGHAIVLAELGLCDYRGKAPRDPDLFAGPWSRPRRADHLLWRLAFTHALWLSLGWPELMLYRAAATDGAFQPLRPATFISATFSREVADAHFRGGPATRVAVLWRQRVPVERALMTFLETQAMNQRFREAETVLLADPSNGAF